LHGVGANEAGLTDLAAQQDERLTVILVRAPLQFGPMQFGFFQVNFTDAGPIINAKQAEQSRRMLIAMIEGLPAVYGVDASKVWITGFSQGGILSSSVGLTRPDLVRGFGILSGRILPEIYSQIAPSKAFDRCQAFVSHGVRDSKLKIDFARSAQKILKQNGLNLTYQEYSAGHELNAEMRSDYQRWLSQAIDLASCESLVGNVLE
jgi:phospholipase/carboxylesterase